MHLIYNPITGEFDRIPNKIYKVSVKGNYQYSDEHYSQSFPIELIVIAKDIADCSIIVETKLNKSHFTTGYSENRFDKMFKIKEIDLNEKQVVLGIYERTVACNSYGFEFLD